MTGEQADPLTLDDDALLGQCEVHYYKSSGPGGQHRNKVSSAVRLHHKGCGVSAHGDDSRSQHENKRLALKRLRMNIACQVRRDVDLRAFAVPRDAGVSPATDCAKDDRGRDTLGTRERDARATGDAFAPAAGLPAFVAECMFTPRGRGENAARRLEIGVKDFRFWRVAAFLLDVLQACNGRVGDAAAVVGITTGNFSDLLTGERHLLAAAQGIRKANGLKPLS